jgi:hypothetical protein
MQRSLENGGTRFVPVDRQLLVMTGGTADTPDLKWFSFQELLRRNRKRNWISGLPLSRFGREAGLQQRCWLTGVQLYFVPVKVLEANVVLPWSITREHLVNARDGGKGQGDSNLVFVGAIINKHLGHVPLPFKLHLRSELAGRELPRDAPTLATYHCVRQAIIDVQRRHLVGKHYAWQKDCFAPGSHEHKSASALRAEMRAAEQEFLAFDSDGRRQWLAEFRWRW